MDRDADERVLLAAVRTAMGVSVRAADVVGTSPVQLRALTVLSERPGLSVGQLAEGMRVAVSTASRLADRLAAAGLADRRPSAADGRSVVLRLTADGERLLDRYDDLRLADLTACLDRLPPDRRHRVLTGLRALTSPAEPPTGTGRDRTPRREDQP
ncbi:MarR family winged helix-turn-helix transcriptional regulator [Geodermatophilus sp. SYSU D00766]